MAVLIQTLTAGNVESNDASLTLLHVHPIQCVGILVIGGNCVIASGMPRKLTAKSEGDV